MSRPMISPAPCGRNSSFRAATILGSSCLSVPAAVFAGVSVEFFAGVFLGLVDFGELGAGDENLAADFEDGVLSAECRVLSLEAQGDVADGFGVVGDVVAGGAAAAGSGGDEESVFVAEGEGDAVDFGFAGVAEVLMAEEFFDAGVEVADFFLAVGVVNGHHALGVADGGEGVNGFAADALGGGVRSDPIRVERLRGPEVFEEGVVFLVGDFGLGFLVIEVVMVADLVAKFFQVGRSHELLHGQSQPTNCNSESRRVASKRTSRPNDDRPMEKRPKLRHDAYSM